MPRVSISQTGSLTDAVAALNKGLTKGTREAAKVPNRVARKAILDVTKARRGGRLSMSRMNLRRLSLRPWVRATPTTAYVVLRAVPAGPWGITEYGTQPHVIKARVKDALTVNRAPYEEVNHPGAKGFHVWETACRAADEATAPALDDTYDEAMKGAM